MAKASNTLRKSERLKSRKAIEYLFRHGKSHTVPPFRMVYMENNEQDFPVLMTVAVPKRMIRNAVSRNLIKRRTREAYRLKKNSLYQHLSDTGRKYRILFLYQTDDILDYRLIEKSVGILMQFLKKSSLAS